jgi:hypothetical protein
MLQATKAQVGFAFSWCVASVRDGRFADAHCDALLTFLQHECAALDADDAPAVLQRVALLDEASASLFVH